MMSRRHFVLGAAVAALTTRDLRAQAGLPRIGILSGLPLDKSAAAPALLNALAELGYKDKAGMLLEYRHSDNPAEYPALVQQMIAAKCDVMFALVSEEPARALLDARSNIPIVFIALDYDPVATGIVQSMSRPGGNITGVYVPEDALIAKRLEIAQEVLPGARRFLVLTDAYTRTQLAALRRAAAERRVQLTVIEYAQRPYDFAAGLEAGRRDKVDALILFFSPVFTAHRGELSAVLTRYKVPVIGTGAMASAPGVLLAYSSNLPKLFRRAAEIGVQILKGGKAADIPVQQPLEFDLVVNLKTANALGVKIPQSVMARVTRIIE
jgi:putative ABC transport system substrate-binding protein